MKQPNDTSLAKALATDILAECRVMLMMRFRFLDVALWRMPFVEGFPARTLATDGKALAFNSVYVIHRFQLDAHEQVRDLLHAILHCIFRHPMDKSHENARAWWAACDVVAEATAMEMCEDRFPSGLDAARASMLDELRRLVPNLSLMRLYQLFDAAGADDLVGDEEGKLSLSSIESLFARDDHCLWAYMDDDEGSCEECNRDKDDDDLPSLGDDSQDDEDGNQDDDAEAQSDDTDGTNPSEENDEDGEDADELDDEDDESSEPDDADDTEQSWEDIAKSIEADLESFSDEAGKQAGLLVSQLLMANRKKVDYREFLKRFSVMREDMKINDDEFDYIFYTYGLERYGNMPLVEPLEYQETNRVRDFVIALDTSGSCEGEPIKRFVNKTYEILKESEGFGSQVNIHIVQCDAQVQSDVKITSLEDLKAYTENFELRGFGGTDFRPVFDYVKELSDQGEFDDLRGLIYFTDGAGTYPKTPTPYSTAFVFMDEMPTMRYVPPWAMKVVMNEEDILHL